MCVTKFLNLIFLNIIKAAIFLLAAPTVTHVNGPRPMNAVDMVELKRLNNPQLSPDGKYLLYRYNVVLWNKNKQVQRYKLINLENGDDLPVFPPESHDESLPVPIWSPNSDSFLVVLKRINVKDENADKPKKKSQVYQYNIKSGALRQLTSHSTKPRNITWNTEGTGFYFEADRDLPTTDKELFHKDYVIKEYETRQNEDLWYFDIKTKHSEIVLSGEYFISSKELSVTRDNLLHIRAPGGLRDDIYFGEIWLSDLQNHVSKKLTSNHYAERKPKLSPDEHQFAYIATVNEKGDAYYEDNLFIESINSDRKVLLFPDTPMKVLNFAWAKEGQSLFVLGNIGLTSHLFEYSLETEKLKQITKGNFVIDDWSYNPKLDKHIFLKRSQETVGDIYVMQTGKPMKRVIDTGHELRNRFKLPTQVPYNWTGNGGVRLEGLLVYPLNYKDGGKPFPLVTITHGGPRTSSQFGSWHVSRYLPVLAGAGYGVFLPNHRGGSGYGDKFLRDMVGGYFRNSDDDIMDGIDALIEAGLADPNKLIKQGWSAGGHMTNMLITKTDRFKAAASGAGVADWVSMYGESDIRLGRTPWFKGSPWEKSAPLKTFQKHSPLKNAWRVTTPTLFWGGENDLRVPPTQVILMYRGVKATGTETELYLAPKQPHNFKKPSYKLFKINKELEWYAKHLGQKPPIPILPDISTATLSLH